MGITKNFYAFLLLLTVPLVPLHANENGVSRLEKCTATLNHVAFNTTSKNEKPDIPSRKLLNVILCMNHALSVDEYLCESKAWLIASQSFFPVDFTAFSKSTYEAKPTQCYIPQANSSDIINDCHNMRLYQLCLGQLLPHIGDDLPLERELYSVQLNVTRQLIKIICTKICPPAEEKVKIKSKAPVIYGCLVLIAIIILIGVALMLRYKRKTKRYVSTPLLGSFKKNDQ